VDTDQTYSLRVFIVSFDAASITIFNPETQTIESTVRVGVGPYAMAFDPFDLEEAARHARVAHDPREPAIDLNRYRFAYVASFTNSFVQLIDLDNSRGCAADRPDLCTFETVVFTLGSPTIPKGSN